MPKKADPFDLSRHAGHRPVGELVYDAIRQAISQGLLAPGQRLGTEELSARMNVSRTPVREAFRKLEIDGFVKSRAWRSVVVAEQPDLEEMEVFYALRGALEGLVAYFAARRKPAEELARLGAVLERMEAASRASDVDRFMTLQVDFYDRYVALASSRRLHQITSSIRDALAWAKPVSLARPGRMRQALRELRSVHDAIAAGDPARAERLARDHCRRAYDAFRWVSERRHAARREASH